MGIEETQKEVLVDGSVSMVFENGLKTLSKHNREGSAERNLSNIQSPSY